MHKDLVPSRGPGSGAHFDAGAQWITSFTAKQYQQNLTRIKEEKEQKEEGSMDTIEGLKIPSNLDTVGTVNFVLTQETGKLKPKDLKAAIERNRAEKKLRAEEQQKIREQGGSAGGSGLDLRSVLAEERLNNDVGDAFKRQLREMAFLADVDDVAKEEVEKSFRTSEEYLGSNLLTAEDIASITAQRIMSQV